MTLDRLVLGERTGTGESGGAWFGTYDGEPVVVKRAEADARPRLEAVASLLDRLRTRGVPTPAYTLLDDESGEVSLVQSLLPGSVRDGVGPSLVEDLRATSESFADMDGVPSVGDSDFPALLQHSLVEGESGSEHVKANETTSHADLMSASGLGSLIHATVGSFGGVGRRWRNLAGLAA